MSKGASGSQVAPGLAGAGDEFISRPSGFRRFLRVASYAAPSAIALIFALVLMVESRNISGRDSIYPRVVIALLIVVSVLAVIADIRAGLRPIDPTGESDIEGSYGRGIAMTRTLIGCANLVLFAIIGGTVGFFIGLAIMSIVFMRVLGVRTLRWAIVWAIAMVVPAYLLFTLGFGIRFNSGLLF